MRSSTGELAAHLGGELVGPDVNIDGASIDSRTTRPGQLYVPIVAERDGHTFIPAALEAGARAYITEQEPMGGTAIRVPDTATALLSLGAFARGRVGGAIGITGSVGKTTTKDLLAGCLASTFCSAANERSFNNELGLPLTLLNAPDAARWVVLEMGARRAGDIERLAQVARPDIGIVTRVAKAHVEYFGDLDGVARAKGELVATLPASGLAVLNYDDPRVRDMSSRHACPVLGYAINRDADVRADHVTLDQDLRARFRLSSPWGQTDVRLAVRGLHQVVNALAAATAALWCGVPIEAVAAALAVNPGSPLRMEVHHVPNGPVLVVDCYNANPESTKAALCSLAGLASERKLAILGLMAELGPHRESEHRRIAHLAAELGIEVVGYQTALYGDPHVTSVEQAVGVVAVDEPEGRRARQGQPGGAARRRRARLRAGQRRPHHIRASWRGPAMTPSAAQNAQSGRPSPTLHDIRLFPAEKTRPQLYRPIPLADRSTRSGGCTRTGPVPPGSVHPAAECIDEFKLVAFGGRLALIGRDEDQIDISTAAPCSGRRRIALSSSQSLPVADLDTHRPRPPPAGAIRGMNRGLTSPPDTPPKATIPCGRLVPPGGLEPPRTVQGNVSPDSQLDPPSRDPLHRSHRRLDDSHWVTARRTPSHDFVG